MNIRIVEVGAAKLDSRNNSLTIQIKGLRGEDDQDQKDLGFVPVWGPWGECGIPDEGTQALYVEGIGVIAFRNPGISAVFGAMKQGDKACFASDGARTFWKKATREVTTMVKTEDGKDAYTTLNGSEEKAQTAIKGCGAEISETGINHMTPGSYSELKSSGEAIVNGSLVSLGPAPAFPVAVGPQPGAVSTGVVA